MGSREVCSNAQGVRDPSGGAYAHLEDLRSGSRTETAFGMTAGAPADELTLRISQSRRRAQFPVSIGLQNTANSSSRC